MVSLKLLEEEIRDAENVILHNRSERETLLTELLSVQQNINDAQVNLQTLMSEREMLYQKFPDTRPAGVSQSDGGNFVQSNEPGFAPEYRQRKSI